MLMSIRILTQSSHYTEMVNKELNCKCVDQKTLATFDLPNNNVVTSFYKYTKTKVCLLIV